MLSVPILFFFCIGASGLVSACNFLTDKYLFSSSSSHSNHTIISVTNLTRASLNASHFVFPVLGNSGTNMIYGQHFIPILQLKNAYLVTKVELFISIRSFELIHTIRKRTQKYFSLDGMHCLF